MLTIGKQLTPEQRVSKAVVDIMANLGLAYPKKIDEALPKNMVCGIQDDTVAA